MIYRLVKLTLISLTNLLRPGQKAEQLLLGESEFPSRPIRLPFLQAHATLRGYNGVAVSKTYRVYLEPIET